MTEIVPFSEQDARLMWRALSRWVRVVKGNPTGRLVAGQVKRNYPTAMSADELDMSMPRAATPLNLRTRGWILGAPLQRAEHVIPVATVTLGGVVDGVHTGVAIRVALLQERGDGTVLAEGWRFEEGETEGDTPAHPYAHAQAIVGWVKGSDCLLHPPHAEEGTCNGIDLCSEPIVDADRKDHQALTLVKHPAFPLGVRTMTGLALNVVATLYGSAGAADIVRGDPMFRAVGETIASDLRILRLRE